MRVVRSTKAGKKLGYRIKNPNFMSLSQASAVAKFEGIQSRSQYRTWHDMYKPYDMPKQPNKVYKKDWMGWPHFLGNNNKFKEYRKYTNYENAFIFARQSNIKTKDEWVEKWRNDELPRDIPCRPDILYRKRGFKGWKHFLGTGPLQVAQAVEMAKQAEKQPHILLFTLPDSNLINQIHISVHPTIETAKKYLINSQHQFLKLFKLPSDYDWRSIVLQYGTDYGEGDYIIENVNELLFNIDLEYIN
jgi:hypothetical protein